jgi:hypothetical protein
VSHQGGLMKDNGSRSENIHHRVQGKASDEVKKVITVETTSMTNKCNITIESS